MSQPDPEEEKRFAALFAALEAPAEPTDEQYRRWRRTLVVELGARRRRRWLAAGAALAASVAVVLVALSGLGPDPAAPAVADVMAAFGGNVVREDGAVIRTLSAGDRVAAGEQVESGLRSGLGLRIQGLDLRVDAQTRLRVAADHLELLAGRIYVDAGPGPAAGAADASAAALSIRTPFATIRHTGTQFLVTVTADRTVAAVREGAIAVTHPGGELRMQAQADGAAQVSLGAGGSVLESQVSPVGDTWAWALAVSPGMVLAGQSADRVLRWAARERGQQLSYDDAEVQRIAGQVLLGGGALRLAPDQAVAVVATAAPSLRIEERGAVMTVSLEPPAGP